MVRISWARLSVDDLKSIAEYIGRESKYYAKVQILKISNRTKVLKLQPYSGKIVPEVNDEIIPELIEGNYRIIYEITSEELITILTVHHSSRDLNTRKFI